MVLLVVPAILNDLGQVVGLADTATGEPHAFLWTAEDGMIDLGTLGGPFISSWAYLINNRGHVAGRSQTSVGLSHAFLWTPENGMVDLGTLPEFDDYNSADMNNHDQIIGTTSSHSLNISRPFVWTPENGTIDLSEYSELSDGYVTSINNHGQIVGWGWNAAEEQRLGLWTVSSNNSFPSVDANGPYSVYEGGSCWVSANGTNPDGQELIYAWDLDNNGSYETSGQSVEFSAAQFDGPNSPTILAQVTNSNNLTAADQTTVTVLNAAPVVGTITAPIAPIQVNSGTNVSVNFTDPGVLDTHTAIWDWGDNNTSNGLVTEANGFGSVTGSHVYVAPGVYTVRITVTDDDGI